MFLRASSRHSLVQEEDAVVVSRGPWRCCAFFGTGGSWTTLDLLVCSFLSPRRISNVYTSYSFVLDV